MLKFLQNECNRIRLKLVLLSLDWVLDIGTAANHFTNGRWIEASFTYLIVFGSGCIITIGFLRYSDIRKDMIRGAKDAGLLFRLLLYIPTFFPIVSAKLWLNSASKLKDLPQNANKESQEKAQKEKEQFQDWAMKAFWSETVFESKPQALLQTLFLLENDFTFSSVFDALPIVLAVWSVHSITNTIYTFVLSNYEDKTPITSRLYGISYTVLSILSPTMVMSVTRSRIYSNNGTIFGTFISLGVYYILFEVIYQLTYLAAVTILVRGNSVSESFSEESPNETTTKSLDKPRQFSRLYQLVVSILFMSCAVTWYTMWFVWDMSSVRLRKRIIMGLVSTSLFLNLLSYFMAADFVTEVYRLKNVKMVAGWEKLAKRMNKDNS